MSLIEKIQKDSLESRKAKNKELSKILVTLISEISKIGKDNGNRETKDSEAIKVIQKFKKNAEATCNIFVNNGADSKELESYIEEISIYDSYLPKSMTEEELTNLIKDIVSHDSSINIGKVMKFLSAQYPGAYDAKKASEIARKLIS